LFYSKRKLRNLFEDIQLKVREQFLDDQRIRYTAPAGFFFLRFIGPALMAPKLFGLVMGKCFNSFLAVNCYYDGGREKREQRRNQGKKELGKGRRERSEKKEQKKNRNQQNLQLSILFSFFLLFVFNDSLQMILQSTLLEILL